MRKYIAKFLETVFVPMDKWKRFKYERWFINHKFPFKKLIVDIWYTEIHDKYPNIWKFPIFVIALWLKA